MIFNSYIKNEEILFLPFSDNVYKVSLNGNVYKNNVEVEKQKDEVFLDWVFGKKFYKLNLLLAHTFKPLYLDVKWWNKIEVIFADKDESNIHPENLVWKFPIGLGSLENNGFSFIPMFSRYMIDLEGVVFDTKTKRLISGSFNQGYHSFRLMKDGDKKGYSSLKRHRGICLAFTDYPHNVDEMQVNHKDGITENDYLGNLEWVTGSENILHAFALGLRKPGPTPIKVRNSKTKEIFNFISLGECGKFLGYSPTYIGSRLRDDSTKIHKDYLQFKRTSDTSEWFAPDNVEKNVFENSWQKEILVKCLDNENILEFKNARAVSIFLSVSEGTLSKYLNQDRINYLYKKDNKFFVIKYKYSILNWSSINDPEQIFNCQNSNFKPVVLVDTVNKTVTEFPNSLLCANFLKMLPTTLNYRLSLKGKKIFSDGTQVFYKEDYVSFKKAPF